MNTRILARLVEAMVASVISSKINKKYCRTQESVQCDFFIFDHVTSIQFKICCCVQNFMKIELFFSEIWRYINSQNGGRLPSWNCFTTIQDQTTHEVSVAGRSCLSNFMSIWYTDLKIWILRMFSLKCLFRPPKLGF